MIHPSIESLFGLYNPADLISFLRTQGASGYGRFEDMLNRGEPQTLARLPEGRAKSY